MNSKVVLDAELNAKLCDLGITEFGIPDDFRGLTCPVKSGGRMLISMEIHNILLERLTLPYMPLTSPWMVKIFS